MQGGEEGEMLVTRLTKVLEDLTRFLPTRAWAAVRYIWTW